MANLWILLMSLDILAVLIFSAIVISRKRDPFVTLAWILTFFVLSYLGILLYIFFGFKKFRRQRKRKPNPARRAFFANAKPGSGPHELPPDLAKISKMALKLTEFPVTDGNHIVLYEEAYATYGAIAESIKSAKHHVHMEYYIFQPDETGLYFRDLLIEKAKEGVECRLLLDAVGSFHIRKNFIRPLREAGVQVDFFGPVRVFRRLSYGLRNHRKIVVVDGKAGFVGSQNIGNEYLQWRNRKLSWRDSQVKIEGPAVQQLQTIFTEDWGFTTGEEIAGPKYFPKEEKRGGSLVQTLPTGPDEEEHTLSLIFLAAIHEARERVTITTPYFVPDTPMIMAMEGAASRGVHVDLLLPHKSDQRLLDLTRRSWYRELLQRGIHIYEYEENFIHAKVVTIDHRLSLVGSANMDVRSFIMNFEATLLLYDEEATSELQESFDKSLAKSRPILLEDMGRLWWRQAFVDGICRVISPLL